MNRRHFVLQGDSSNKFWEIRTDGSAVVTRHGLLGRAGRETTMAFASPSEAEARAVAAIRAKEQKGYREEDTSDEVTSGPRVSASGPVPTDPRALVERLAAALERQRPDFVAGLPPPATAESIAALEKELGLPLPASLKALLAWHDGTEYESLIDDLSLSSVHSISTSKKTFDGLNPTSEAPGQWWNEKWIPILDDHSYDKLVIDWAGSFGGRPGQILQWSKDGASRTILFASFDHLLQTFVLGLEAGFYAETGNGFVADELDLARIRHSLYRRYPKDVVYRVAAKGTRVGDFAEVGKLTSPARDSVTGILPFSDGARLVLGQIEAPVLSVLDMGKGQVERLEERGESVLELSFGADESEVVYLFQTGQGWRGAFELRLRSLRESASRTLARFPMKCEVEVLSVVPGLAAFNTPEGIEVRELPSGKQLHFLPTERDAVAAFSPDGRWLAVSVAGSSTIELRAWPGLEVAWTATGEFTRARRFAFDPSGERLAALVEGEHMSTSLALFELATGAELQPGFSDEESQNPCRLTFSPDGSWLVTGDEFGHLVVHEVATGETLWAKQIHFSRVLSIAFSRDGRKIFTGSLGKEPIVIVSTPG